MAPSPQCDLCTDISTECGAYRASPQRGRLDVHFVSPAPVSSPGSAGLQPGSRSHAGAWRSQGKPRRTGSGFMKQTSSLPAPEGAAGSGADGALLEDSTDMVSRRGAGANGDA